MHEGIRYLWVGGIVGGTYTPTHTHTPYIATLFKVLHGCRLQYMSRTLFSVESSEGGKEMTFQSNKTQGTSCFISSPPLTQTESNSHGGFSTSMNSSEHKRYPAIHSFSVGVAWPQEGSHRLETILHTPFYKLCYETCTILI